MTVDDPFSTPADDQEDAEADLVLPDEPASIAPVAVPIMCLPWSASTPLRQQLGVSRERDAATCMHKIILSQLQSKGFPDDLCAKAVAKFPGSPMKAAAWLTKHHEMLRVQLSVMADLNSDVQQAGGQALAAPGEEGKLAENPIFSTITKDASQGPPANPWGAFTAAAMTHVKPATAAAGAGGDGEVEESKDAPATASKFDLAAVRPTLSQLLLKDQVWPLATAWEMFCDAGTISAPNNGGMRLGTAPRGRPARAAAAAVTTPSPFGSAQPAVTSAPRWENVDVLTLLGSVTNLYNNLYTEYAARAVVAGFVAVTGKAKYNAFCSANELRMLASYGLNIEPFLGFALTLDGAAADATSASPDAPAAAQNTADFRDRLAAVLRDPSDGPLVAEVLMREITTALANSFAPSNTKAAEKTGEPVVPIGSAYPFSRLLVVPPGVKSELMFPAPVISVRNVTNVKLVLPRTPLPPGVELTFHASNDKSDKVVVSAASPAPGNLITLTVPRTSFGLFGGFSAGVVHFDITGDDSALMAASSLAHSYEIQVFGDESYWCSLSSALAVADVMLSVSDGAAMSAAERLLVLRLLFTLLSALPFTKKPLLAADTCKTITRLCRRWVQRAGVIAFGREAAAFNPAVLHDPAAAATVLTAQSILSMSEVELCHRVVSLLPRLERSHSWLRTVCLSRASTSLSAPIKALMELLVAFKKTVVTLPQETLTDEVRELVSYNVTTRRSAADTTYLMGREGPSIASLVQPAARVVLPDMAINGQLGMGGGHLFTHADVAVRTGKWYYEVTITQWPDMNARGGFGGGTWLSVGWMSSSLTEFMNGLGEDNNGNGWAFTGPNGSYVHRRQHSAPVVGMNMRNQPGYPGGMASTFGGFGAPSPFGGGGYGGGGFGGGGFGGGGFGGGMLDQWGNPVPMPAAAGGFQFGAPAGAAGGASMLLATAEAAKQKEAGKGAQEAFSFRQGAVIGCGLDLDAGTMWFSFQGVKQTANAYTGPFGESMFPAITMQQMVGARVNLGREPFMMALPEGYLPIEDPARIASSWLARFEHAGDVTETVFARQQLPEPVVDMTFANEDSSVDAKTLSMTYHSKSGASLARWDLSRLVTGAYFLHTILAVASGPVVDPS